MKLLSINFFDSSYCLPQQCKSSPQHPVVRHPQCIYAITSQYNLKFVLVV